MDRQTCARQPARQRAEGLGARRRCTGRHELSGRVGKVIRYKHITTTDGLLTDLRRLVGGGERRTSNTTINHAACKSRRRGRPTG